MKSVRYRVEELFLAIIILLQVFDFIKFLPGDIEYIKRIISIALIGYLLYKADISNIVLGAKQHRYLDFLLIFTFFLFWFKDFVAFAMTSKEEVIFFKELIHILVEHGPKIEAILFYIGGISLLIISAYITFRIDVKKPSFMAIIHEEGKVPHSIGKIIERFLFVFFVLIMFFLFVFNLFVEWLGLAIDAPLVIIGIVLYLFVIIRYHKHFSPDNFIYKLGSLGEQFYEDVVGMFHDKKTVYFGVSGLLILHLITELAVFVIPFIFGFKDLFYHETLLESAHQPLWYWLMEDLQVLGWNQAGILIPLYLLNVIAMISLFILPAILWYKLYQKQSFDVHHVPLAIFIASVVAFLLTPAFWMRSIDSHSFAGVDFITMSVLSSSISPLISLCVALGVGIIVFLMSYFQAKKVLIGLSVFIVDIFFGWYIAIFFVDVFLFYLELFKFLVQQLGAYFIAGFFFLFMSFTVIFYIVGYLVFLKETYLEFKNIK